MNPKLKRLIAFVVVISTILTVGGVIYTSFLGVENSQYTKTTGTIVEIENEKTGEYTAVVKSVTVSYETPEGTKTNKLAGVLPFSFEQGAEVEVRFQNNNTDYVTAEMIDWFPAIFLIVLGVLYAVGGTVVVVFRKKAGYYAIVEQTNDPTPLEDDDFSIADQIEKMSHKEAASTCTEIQDTPPTDNQ